jgi:hypothetical protein
MKRHFGVSQGHAASPPWTGASAHERREADLFFAELTGQRTLRAVRNLGEAIHAETSDRDLTRMRADLLAGLQSADLIWQRVQLAGGFSIRVSVPLIKDGYLLPVTAGDTLRLARRFEVFPLSRAVMDQAHNAATKVAKAQSPTSLYDFVTYSQRLSSTAYYTQYGASLVSGAHKLWVLSSRGPTINYGFYIRRSPTDPVRSGPLLDRRYNVIQSLGGRHNALHWDYSQLLQFMSGLEDENGQRVDLRQALLNRHPAVWDESNPPAASGMP